MGCRGGGGGGGRAIGRRLWLNVCIDDFTRITESFFCQCRMYRFPLGNISIKPLEPWLVNSHSLVIFFSRWGFFVPLEYFRPLGYHFFEQSVGPVVPGDFFLFFYFPLNLRIFFIFGNTTS